MSERRLRPETIRYLGTPTNPMPEIMADAIGQVVAQVPEIREAYLPACFIQGDGEARQVLVVGVKRQKDIPRIMPILMEKMRLVLPAGEFIDIIPYSMSSLPEKARIETCRIFGRPKRQWWRIW